MEILLTGHRATDIANPLPTAGKATIPPLPLVYHARVQAEGGLHINDARLPLAYRVLRVGLWLCVAAAMLAVIVGSVWTP